MFNILVVEDDLKLRKLFSTVLEKNGYRAVPAQDGTAALDLMDREFIDLVVSDIMMPGLDGFGLTETLREAGYTQPVLFVTAKDSFSDKQRGFLTGADDYMVKPIDVNELVLRVGALLRRAKSVSEKQLVIGETTLDYDTLTVKTEQCETVLPQKEFYLLYKLASYPNKIFTRNQIMDEIWGMDSESETRTVDVHINRLRERFKNSTDFEIATVRGLGYKVVKH